MEHHDGISLFTIFMFYFRIHILLCIKLGCFYRIITIVSLYFKRMDTNEAFGNRYHFESG